MKMHFNLKLVFFYYKLAITSALRYRKQNKDIGTKTKQFKIIKSCIFKLYIKNKIDNFR